MKKIIDHEPNVIEIRIEKVNVTRIIATTKKGENHLK